MIAPKKKIEKILEKVKREIVPDGKNDKAVEKQLSTIRKLLDKEGIKVEVMLGGSYAKGTYLNGDFDVDIFIRFGYSYKDENISDILEKAIKSLKPVRLHGSRDYFQINGKISYEIIPVLSVEDASKAINVTDMSPLHVMWVGKNIKAGQKDDIRLAKIFCKANNVYGAESYIQGFSGHVLDILIIHYGSFIELLKNAADWKKPVVIDQYDIFKGNALAELNRSKTVSPLVIIDPIMPERNAAAALNDEKFLLFKKAARGFLEKPNIKFFRKDVIDKKKLLKMKGKNKLLIFDVKAKEGKEDVVGGKLLKAYSYIHNAFGNNTFSVIDSGWEWDKKKSAIFWFIAKDEFLEKSFLRVGPPLKEEYHVQLFRKKHKKTEEKKGRIYAHVKREYRKIEILAKDLAKNDVVREKVDSIKLNFYR